MEALIAVAIFVIVIQLFFSLFQMKYYEKFVKAIAKRYENTSGFNLYTESASKLFSKSIVVLVTNRDQHIVEAYEYSGLTVLSKFKELKNLIGKELNKQLYNETEKLKGSLYAKALLKIIDKVNVDNKTVYN